MRLLVTRPQPDAERTAALLRARGHEALTSPLLRVEPVTAADIGPGPWAGVLLTSANAAAAVAVHPRRAALLAAPAYVVGRRTAQAAQAVGFGTVVSADGDLAGLVGLVAARVAPGGRPLLYLAGEDRAGDLAGELKGRRGLTIVTSIVYRAVPAAEFAPDAQAALAAGGIDGVLHYSRRSAETYLRCAEAAHILNAALAPRHYCLSPQVAAPLANAGAALVVSASQPDENSLVDLIAAPATDKLPP